MNVKKTKDQQKNADVKAREELLAKIRLNNAVHSQGTIAEIAQRLGKSKKEVRRMKQAGELDAALGL